MTDIPTRKSLVQLALSEGYKSLLFGVFGALAIAGTFVLMHGRSHDDRYAITPGQMPACDSAVSRHGLFNTITNAPSAKVIGLTVQKIDAVSELASNPGPAPDQRVCIATVFTNAGRKLVGFTLSWANAARDDVYLELPYSID